MAVVSFGVGAAAAITGGVLYYLGTRHVDTEKPVAIVPHIDPSGAGLVVSGRF